MGTVLPFKNPTDEFGVPFRGSIQKGSPFYWRGDNAQIFYNGRLFLDAAVLEFDRREGWLIVAEWPNIEKYPDGQTPIRKIKGKVEVFCAKPHEAQH